MAVDVFISYSRTDYETAERLFTVFHDLGWEVFIDRATKPGDEWRPEILRELRDARCVVVLWSTAALSSFWVQGEAVAAYERRTYLPVLLDDVLPPDIFRSLACAPLSAWARDLEGERAQAQIRSLTDAIRARIGGHPFHGNAPAVQPEQAITLKHLHLAHSAWRVDKMTPFGLQPYQIHVVLYGHPSALQRALSVKYFLPEYPESHQNHDGGPRERLFELKELANGWTIVQADVAVAQPGWGHRTPATRAAAEHDGARSSTLR